MDNQRDRLDENYEKNKKGILNKRITAAE